MLICLWTHFLCLVCSCNSVHKRNTIIWNILHKEFYLFFVNTKLIFMSFNIIQICYISIFTKNITKFNSIPFRCNCIFCFGNSYSLTKNRYFTAKIFNCSSFGNYRVKQKSPFSLLNLKLLAQTPILPSSKVQSYNGNIEILIPKSTALKP